MLKINVSKPPERLWKYRSWDADGHTKSLIVKGELYYSSIDDLNDPFEFYYQERFPTSDRDIRTFVSELCAQQFPKDSISERRSRFDHMCAEVRSFVAASKKGVLPTTAKFVEGVFCASSRNDDILMWSHYANHHRGVCVSIRPDRISKRFLPVGYSNSVPTIDVREYLVGRRQSPGTFVALSLNKGKQWAYEEEWRSVYRRGAHMFPECVDQVIIGAKAKPDTIRAVWEAVYEAPQKIEVFVAKLNRDSFGINLHSIDRQVERIAAAKKKRRRRRG